MTVPNAAPNDLVGWLDSLPAIEGIRPVDRPPPRDRVMPLRKASYRRQSAPGDPVAAAPQQEIVSLVREAGVLRWRPGATPTLGGQRRAAGRAALPGGEVVKQYAFERLDTSQVYTALVTLDQKLTPAAYPGTANTCLRRFRSGQLEPFTNPNVAAGKDVLLFIHGTFSNSEALIANGLQKTAFGGKLLADAGKHYDYVLTFDHPTLSVSPMLNAFDLAALLRPSPKSVDIVCHSRGGLVARWFCEAYADPALKRRVVFVGSPLAGTSLAAAPRLKSSLDLLTNIAEVLRTASDFASANPLFLAASGLLRIVVSVTGLAAKAPILDAAIALIPGLDGQSRTGNNQELLRLRANTGNSPFDDGQIRYFAVLSNFEPRDMGWNFLRLFSRPLQRIGDWGADIIFQGQNDLIVDTRSMSEVADNRLVTIAHDFGTTDTVHHTNYFVQAKTADAVRTSFAIA